MGSLNSGGVQKLVLDIISNTDFKKFDVYVISWRKGHFYEEYKKILGDRLILLDIPKNNKLNVLLVGMKIFTRMRKIIKKNKIKILHTHLFPMNYYGFLLKLFLKIKLVQTKHNTGKSKLLRFVEKIPDFYYDKITAVSKAVKEDFDNKNKIKVIYNGIPLEGIKKQKPAKDFFDKDYFNLISIGRLTEQKGYDHLIKTFKIFNKKNPKSKLYICGKGELKKDLELLIKKLKLEKKVVLLGERNDVFNLMKSADCFILTSNWEGLGIVFLEAMACKLPVIGSEVDGIPEIVKDGENGFLINRLDYEETSTKIEQIYNNKKLRKKMGGKGHKFVKDFEIKKVVKEYEEIYERVLR